MSNERSYQWSPQGERLRVAAGLSLADVAEAFHDELRIEQPLGTTLVIIAGTTDAGLRVHIACEPHELPGHYTIVAVATPK
jgi:hypothetical protein